MASFRCITAEMLYQISDDPDITMKTIIDNAMRCVTG